MKGYLLDTNVISMLAPGRTDAPAGFALWLKRMDHEGQIFLSVVTIHEIERGVALLENRGATAKARALRGWLAGLMAGYGERILLFDGLAASCSGPMEAAALGAGHQPGMADAIVAATAKTNDLVVLSRNARHFSAFGVAYASPEQVCGGETN